ncbi:uncharacterized protein LOC131655893 [Vicia villosa]|uniref:uncharacterized protein LOC131655893 n=1 Tax=Vicia villosa TaxID=3911 RepID=UPI00273AE6CD|nr:uncharacterized protein LOC131655893 [Vicia villosa]
MDNLSLGVIRPPPESSTKRLKSELDSKSGLESEDESESNEETDTESDDELESKKAQEELEVYLTWESKPIEYLQERYDDDPCPRYFACKNFSYRNKAMLKKEEDSKKAVAEYLDKSRHLSPFDAIPIPPMANVCGNNFPGPIPLTENYRPHFIQLSKLALDYYNHHNQGLNYVFEDIVKVTGRHIPLGTCYITFIAKPKASIQPATTFQSEVWDRLTSLGPPIVKSCSIKT